ncbi:hypothetical protein [Sphingomonas sp. CFBP 8760]|uniref:hypothetical protein n=1 Tax=Sphingomonas sp. CFBP 8760 TaxID=2775282 RepID=UPI00177FB19B|nr:hypothetical protein [Sphingomonas sp. CFBP 8760]MBD8547899.1 hypothetical protein [Sphingomonas sp. CFBP 8760]
MPLPLLAPIVRRRMDPRDTLDVYIFLLQGETLADILQTGEIVTRFSVALDPTAIAAGMIISGEEDAPRYADRVFFVQLKVDPAMRSSAIFNLEGLVSGIEIDFDTNFEGREKQYTIGVKVVNK